MISNGFYVLWMVMFLLYNSIVHKTSTSFATNPETTSSFFERHDGHSLLGYVIGSCAGSVLECGLRCLRNERCRSYNCLIFTQLCKLNGETGTSKPENYKESKGWVYFDLLQDGNLRKMWSSQENQFTCISGFEGNRCQTRKLGYFSLKPGMSCKHIRDSRDSSGDGEYWIDPERNGNPLKVFCDMTTNGGGWLLVANVVLPAAGWTAEQMYRGITNYSNNRMGITKSAIKQLSTHLSFTQMRFHCNKQKGRTFHVITVANDTGQAVVRYFSGQTNDLPGSCGSFQRMNDDNSKLSVECHRWGNDNRHHVGKWGHYNKKGKDRMYNHAAFVAHKYHWVIVNGHWLCDDGGNNIFDTSAGDFWKIYVR